MTRFVPLIALLALAACSNSASVPVQGQARPQVQEEDPSTVVAKVRGESITLGEVDKPIVGELRAQKQAYREKLFELRAHALERMIAERLIDEEAKKRGITSEQLLEEEVVSKVVAPTDDEVRAFYAERQAQGMPGLPPFEQVAGQVRDFLGQERAREATQAFFDKLHDGAGVEILMEAPEPPRLDVEAKGPSKGPANAPVTIVEFSDFECPYCSRANETLAQVAEAYAGKVRIVFRDYPLSFHANAQKAAEAGQCANDQGKFWEMHDKMFANQRALEVENLKLYAKDIGLDAKAFDACLDGGGKAAVVRENFEAGLDLGVRGTPAFFINGKMVAGALPFEEFQKIIDQELGQGAVKSASD